MPELAIVGPGGVGGFLAAALDRAGEPVTVVAREETAATLNERGMSVRSVRLGDFHAQPLAVSSLDVAGMTVVVATKADGLAGAMARLRGEARLIVPLLNGLDHLERLGPRAVAASIRIESTRVATGRIEQTSGFLRIDIGPPSWAVEQFAEAMRGAGVPVDVLDSPAEVMWGKLVRLNALALATSAYDMPLGPIRDDPERFEVLRSAVEEAAAVARAEGATGDPERTMAELDDAHAELMSSMQRDIAAGREPELDAIAGSVLRAASRHDLECPTIERLYARVAERAGMIPRP
jgi:2-dehydropantoate 2-reductase